ncbi:unnamed protein product [Lymnaea stagnalis]|uniref:Uncharacterized protein n=1 Tax=Lymnaea stagnalis TaxID=6523 RepID=A0AAV2HTL6_LYMST
MWAEKRGGGGVRGARGSSFGNRGAISSNRGSRGGAFGRGRGRGDRGGKVSEPITRTDIGVGLTSLHDVIKSASCRKIIGNQEPISPNSPMNLFIERWKAFALGFTDCGNAVSNIECSLKASKLSQLQLNFECKFLAKCSIYSIFTGVLSVNKLLNNAVAESTFLARGMGLSKKSAKMDCYEKAYKLLFNSSIQEIMNQEDCGEEFLTQEVTILYKDNPKGFMDLLKKSNALADIEAAPPSATTGKGRGSGGSKRTSNVRPGGTDPKRGRFTDHLTDILENKHLSLAPQKKVGILMHPNDSLYDKLEKLKELLKEEGITKLHIVPKIDQIAHKTAIHIKNVYRFQDVPILGFESRMPVYCEIYFDDVFMADGAADFKRNTAMQLAYTNLSNRLYSQPLEAIVNTARLWEPYMVSEPDICNVVTKWQGEDNNSLLTSNLANMKQMMQSMPDVNLPIDCMVLTEHESDKDIQNVFKALELSATRNLMLLECEIVRNPDMKFTCSLSLQGRLLSSRTHFTKNGAKRSCSEAVMNEMKKKHDYIFVTSKFIGHTITREELELLGAKKKALGEPPGKIFHKRNTEEQNDIIASADDSIFLKRNDSDLLIDPSANVKRDNVDRADIPPVAKGTDIALDSCQNEISLEDLMVNVNNMPKSQRDMVTSCASKMGLRVITKLKNTHDSSLLRRTVTAQDMSKILQLNGGESGRYKLVSCKNPLLKDDLEKFKEECLEHHRKLVEARNNDDPDAEPPVEKKTLDPSHLVKGDAIKSTCAKPDQAVKPIPKTVPPLFSTVRPLIPPMMRRQGPRPLMGPRYPFDGPPRMARPRFFPF